MGFEALVEMQANHERVHQSCWVDTHMWDEVCRGAHSLIGMGTVLDARVGVLDCLVLQAPVVVVAIAPPG
jgi:hypothetical protein